MALLTGLTAVNVYRAATQSIVYDEAFTYLMFLTGSPALLFTTYTANNHVFFNLIARITVYVFGASELALRLPSVVSAIAYFWALLALCRLVFGTSVLFLVTVAALSLNPFVLDFLSAARGYGMALALFTIALYQLTQSRSADRRATDRRWLAASVALALSVSANLTFLFPSVALASIAVVLEVGRREREKRFHLLACIRRAALWLAAPGLLVGTLLLATPLSHARREHFFYGAATLNRSVQSLIEVSLKHTRGPWPAGPERLPADLMSRMLEWLVVIPLLLLVCLSIVRAARSGRLRPLDVNERFLVLTGGTLVLTLTELAAVRWGFDAPYPFGRTGLYLIIIFVLATAALVRMLQQAAGRTARTLAAVLTFLMFLLVGRFAIEFNTGYYYDWRFDSGTRPIFDIIADWPHPTDSGPVRVATSRWLFGPSLEFYRVVRADHRIGPIAEDWEARPSDYDFFVVSPGADLELARTHAEVIYVHRDSGAVLLVNRKRLSIRNQTAPITRAGPNLQQQGVPK